MRPLMSWFFTVILTALTLSLFSAPLEAAVYDYTDKESKVMFTLKHLGIVTVHGDFREFAGEFTFDRSHIEASKVSLVIKTKSLQSNNKKRDKDLKSKNFFWPQKYPDIIFESREIRNIQGARFDIHGDLTIRGVTHPVVFATELLTPMDQISNEKPLHFYTETYITRKQYNLGTGGIMNPIVFVTNESLKISLDVHGILAPPERQIPLIPPSTE